MPSFHVVVTVILLLLALLLIFLTPRELLPDLVRSFAEVVRAIRSGDPVG